MQNWWKGAEICMCIDKEFEIFPEKYGSPKYFLESNCILQNNSYSLIEDGLELSIMVVI